ncbi:MAG: hypothetical protein EXX96DRAFT_617246 [Benjaminiella poitrasii]|nr:MAG: hypothetical protein EXX96DRAFT_617246 [Benjaminiella poitrasii]
MSCHEIGHGNAASKLCPYHIWSKNERLKNYLDNDYEVGGKEVMTSWQIVLLTVVKNTIEPEERRRIFLSVKDKNKDIKWKPQSFTNSPSPVLLIVFGEGMNHKDNVKIKGYLPGVTELLYKKLMERQSCYLTALVDIDEYRTFELQALWSIMESKPECLKNILNISLLTWSGHGKPDIYKRNLRSKNSAVGSD